MLQLFKIEWLKIKTYRTFWILFGAFLVFFPITFLIASSKFMEQFSGTSMQESMLKTMMGSPFIFPKVWQSAAWFGGLFFILIGMLFIILVTNEVQYKTHRQNLIDGWSRINFLVAKSSMLLFFVITSSLLVFITGLVGGLWFTPNLTGEMIFSGLKFIPYYILMATLYLIVAFAIALLVKRTGLAIVIYFAFVFMVDNLLWLALTYKGGQAGYFLPLESVDSLVANPFKPSLLEKRTVSDASLVISAVCYGLIIMGLLIRFYKKTDLKS